MKDGELIKCDAEHEIIILGAHNVGILDALIEFISSLQFEANLENVSTARMKLNYSNIETNVDMCNNELSEFSLQKVNANKIDKLRESINKMEAIAEKVVTFFTYKDALLYMGVPKKEINNYEQSLTKEYVAKYAIDKMFKNKLLIISATL